MTDRPKPGGYVWRQHVRIAIQANREARKCLRRLLDERPTPALAATLIAQAACSLNDGDDALHELERIGSKEDTRSALQPADGSAIKEHA